MIYLRFASTLVGFSLLILGILILLFGSFTYTVSVPRPESKLIFDDLSFVVGDFEVYNANLAENVTVRSIASIKIPATGGPGDINFYITDGEGFQEWRRGEAVEFIIEKERTGDFNLSFESEKYSTYYFIFDNSFSELYKKEVIFTVEINYVEYVEEVRENESLKLLGYPAIVIGIIVTILGLIKKQELKWE